MRIGVMQGRLVPPIDDKLQSFPAGSWRAEFSAGSQAGVGAVEWIYDADDSARNPLASDHGVAEIQALVRTTRTIVSSICADWFMTHPIVRGDDGILEWLLDRAALVGAGHVVIPFVDDSALSSDDVPRAAEALLRAHPAAERAGVEIHLETSLEPRLFATLLAELPENVFRVTYDIGNSASLGHDPREEFAADGGRIGSVHVKDRVRGGGSVPLGRGDASLPAVFRELRRSGFDGWFVLQAARGEDGREVEWVAEQRHVVEQAWEDAG
jgi:L-ribulose-5-phosphate 3-epimerase